MTKEEMKEYSKAYYQEHKDELRSKFKEYYQLNKDKWKAHYKEHKDEIKVRSKEHSKTYYKSHKDKWKAHYKEHKDEIKENHQSNKDRINTYHKSYNKTDTNFIGVSKNTIRGRSNRYLFNTLKHSKLNGYEIHHCFGYENHKQFIYIPKELHLQIHQFLRDNGISADSNHFSQIVHLINAWEGYTYIKV